MTRTQDNSLLHRTAGTGIVPPLEVLLSVALRCGSVAVASAIVAFAFGLAFVSGFVFLPSLARLLLWALPAAFAYGHQSLHTVSLPLHVWPPSLPDVNIWALFEGTYQLLERVMDVGETILASPTLARPDVQWLLVGGLTMVTVLLWIHVEPWLASLDGREASGEDAEPCDDEGVVYAEEAEGDNQQGWCMECVVGSQGRWYAEYVAGDKFWLAPTVDVCDTAVSDPGDADEQYLDAAEWAEEVSPVGDFVGTGGEDGGAEDEGTTDEEDGSLDAEEEVTGDTPPQDLVESYGTSASEDDSAGFASEPPSTAPYHQDYRVTLSIAPPPSDDLVVGFDSHTSATQISLASSLSDSSSSGLDDDSGEDSEDASLTSSLSDSSSSGLDSDSDDDSEDAPTSRLLQASDVNDNPFTSNDGGPPVHFRSGPNRRAYMFSKEFPKDYLLDRGFADTYVLEKELGKGGNGFVMSARHRGTGKKVAVKFMAKRKIAENAWMQVSESRWVPREIVLAYNLSHQYIIKCENDLFDDDMYFYIVQELHGDQWNHSSGSGNSLFDYRMQVGQLPERTARHIFKQIASGVMALHNMGVSHCDLKLENVLIDRKLNTKIIDLGSAVTAEPGASPPTYTRDTFCGTIPYAAPEIPGQERYEAAPTDVWCLGLILCELATGFSAVQRTSGPDELRDSGVLDECSRELQSLLLGFCLNADPKERATMAEVMAHPWMQQA